MSFQPSVVKYFNNRKRTAVDGLKNVSNPTKVFVVDGESEPNDVELPKSNHVLVHSGFPKKIVFSKKGANNLQSKKLKLKPSVSSKSGLTSISKGSKGGSDGIQTDIRKSLFMTTKRAVGKEEMEHDSTSETSKDKPHPTDYPNVPFHVKGTLSPAKQKPIETSEGTKLKEITLAGPLPEENKLNVDDSQQTHELSTSTSRKELNLGNIKAAMKTRSSRMEELKAALKRFNENKEKLTDLQAKNAEPGKQDIQKNELEVIPSLLKTPTKVGHLLSPKGKLTPSRLFATPPTPSPQSPLKSPLKSPAFQRYQALVTEGRPALVLPFKYRALAELFRSVDTVASMLYNRKETITLNKLRPAVQEMSRKNLTEYHMGQIKTVLPNAFDFSIEKMRVGSVEKYELIIKPQLSADNKDGEVAAMGPNVLLARRRTLFSSLLELTKDHHEVFLKSLDPPMNIPRSRITRWHPEFMVDDVPDIVSAALPQPPNVERVATAKDVLEKAHKLIMVNRRMERALQRVSENNASSAPTLSKPSIPMTPPTTPTIKAALHGLPASLLEKVRAKQAARALEAMTRTPAQAKEAVRLTRLPELARILRNLFVTEKKGVLTREMVLEKLADSYRESLSNVELDDHLKLLAEKTPGWVTFCNLRKTDYVKLSRNADMNRIMTRLEALAAEKCI